MDAFTSLSSSAPDTDIESLASIFAEESLTAWPDQFADSSSFPVESVEPDQVIGIDVSCLSDDIESMIYL